MYCAQSRIKPAAVSISTMGIGFLAIPGRALIFGEGLGEHV
jgi:hypothetical protein